VTLADTSAWVEFLRGTGSEVNDRLRALLERDELAATDAVLMEVLAGARDEAHARRLRRLLGRCEFLATSGPGDYEQAATLYRACRRGGETVRALTDCLIAAVAIRAEVPVLHADSDFEALARHAPLELA
jgi:predicted nucleic acid-binding protein